MRKCQLNIAALGLSMYICVLVALSTDAMGAPLGGTPELKTSAIMSSPRVEAPPQSREALPAELHHNVPGGRAALPIVIPTFPYSAVGTTEGLNDDCHGGGNSSPDVVYSFVAQETRTLFISHCGSDFDTRLEVRTGGASPGRVFVACNDDSHCRLAPDSVMTTQSELLVPLLAGLEYFIVVDGAGAGDKGDYILVADCNWCNCCNGGRCDTFPCARCANGDTGCCKDATGCYDGQICQVQMECVQVLYLNDFGLESKPGGIRLTWDIRRDLAPDTYAFDLWRRPDSLSSFTRVGDISFQDERKYRYMDNEVEDGRLYQYRLEAISQDGKRHVAGAASMVHHVVQRTLADAPEVAIGLAQNHPNPFREGTQIQFALTRSSRLTLRVFDSTGRMRRGLVDHEFYQPGQFQMDWDGRDEVGNRVPAGMYYLKFETSFEVRTLQLVVLR